MNIVHNILDESSSCINRVMQPHSRINAKGKPSLAANFATNTYTLGYVASGGVGNVICVSSLPTGDILYIGSLVS